MDVYPSQQSGSGEGNFHNRNYIPAGIFFCTLRKAKNYFLQEISPGIFIGNFSQQPIGFLHAVKHFFLCFPHIVEMDENPGNKHQKEEEKRK